MKKINGGMELEFLYSYKGYRGSNEIIWKCWLWLGKKPYHKECELVISYKDIAYKWNKIHKDRPW